MNSRQMQYAVQLAEAGSFSQLAEKLQITQPALSKQILALEKELGVQLFDRSTTPLTLTPAGIHFVAQAKDLLYQEKQLEKSMEQYKSGELGRLTIGATPFRSTYLLPDMVKKLREKFPGIQVKIVEKGSALLRKDAADGKFDFAVVNLPVDEAVLDATAMEADHLVLVVPEALASINVDTTDFARCEKLPFVVVSPGQEMRTLFDRLCRSTDTHPAIAAEVISLTTAWEMACRGVGATLLPLQFVRRYAQNGIQVVKLNDKVTLRQPAIVVKRGQYLSQHAKYAISLLTE